MGILPTCMSMYRVHALPKESIKNIAFCGTGVRDSFKLPCGCWAFNSGALEEQSEFLTSPKFSSSYCLSGLSFSQNSIGTWSILGASVASSQRTEYITHLCCRPMCKADNCGLP